MNGLSVNVSRQIDYLSKSNTALSRKCQIWLPKQVLPVRFTAFSLPGQLTPWSESASRTLALANLLTGTFAAWPFRSVAKWPGTFVPWNFRTQEYSLPITFSPWNFRSLLVRDIIYDILVLVLVLVLVVAGP